MNENEEKITLERPKDEDYHVYAGMGSDVTLGLEKILFHTGVPRKVPSFYLDDVKLAPLIVTIPAARAEGYLKRLSDAKDYAAQFRVRLAIVEDLKEAQEKEAEKISKWATQEAAAENEKRRAKLCNATRIYIPGFDPDPDEAAKKEAAKRATSKDAPAKIKTDPVPAPGGAGDKKGGS